MLRSEHLFKNINMHSYTFYRIYSRYHFRPRNDLLFLFVWQYALRVFVCLSDVCMPAMMMFCLSLFSLVIVYWYLFLSILTDKNVVFENKTILSWKSALIQRHTCYRVSLVEYPFTNLLRGWPGRSIKVYAVKEKEWFRIKLNSISKKKFSFSFN